MKEIRIYFVSGNEMVFSAEDAVAEHMEAAIMQDVKAHRAIFGSKTVLIPTTAIERIEISK